MIKKKNFDLFYDSLSVGWHLRKIMENDPDLINDERSWNRFILWLERHRIKTWKKSKDLIDKK